MRVLDKQGLNHASREIVGAHLLHGVVAEQAHCLVTVYELHLYVRSRCLPIVRIGGHIRLCGAFIALFLREEVVAQGVGLRGLNVNKHTVVEQGSSVVERVAEIDGCSELSRDVHLQARGLLGRVAVAVLEEQGQAGELLSHVHREGMLTVKDV